MTGNIKPEPIMLESKISINSKRLLSPNSLEEITVSNPNEKSKDEQLISHALKEDPKQGHSIYTGRAK